MAAAEGQGIGKYLAVYACLLVVTAAQFIIGYQHIGGGQLVTRMLTFAAIETGLVVLFWMNLSSEKRNFIQFVIIFTVFVLLCMNYVWTDSFRLLLFRLTGYGPS